MRWLRLAHFLFILGQYISDAVDMKLRLVVALLEICLLRIDKARVEVIFEMEFSKIDILCGRYEVSSTV